MNINITSNIRAIHASPIPDFSGYYADQNGQIFSTKRQPALKQISSSVNKSGYRMIAMVNSYGDIKNEYVHRLVARTFLGEAPDGQIVCHFDHVKTNCALSNLRYDSRSQNVRDTIEAGNARPSERKLTPDDVRAIRAAFSGGRSTFTIADDFGISRPMVSKIVNRIAWKKVL
jgi:predicted DNA binding protein